MNFITTYPEENSLFSSPWTIGSIRPTHDQGAQQKLSSIEIQCNKYFTAAPIARQNYSKIKGCCEFPHIHVHRTGTLK